jgi:hypothetical protein
MSYPKIILLDWFRRRIGCLQTEVLPPYSKTVQSIGAHEITETVFCTNIALPTIRVLLRELLPDRLQLGEPFCLYKTLLLTDKYGGI